MIPKEVFLSHSSEDHLFTASVAETIRRHGDWFVVVLSPNAAASMWVRRELQYALSQRRFEKKIVPILHLPCDPELLS